jgi:hypothetical protein
MPDKGGYLSFWGAILANTPTPSRRSAPCILPERNEERAGARLIRIEGRKRVGDEGLEYPKGTTANRQDRDQGDAQSGALLAAALEQLPAEFRAEVLALIRAKRLRR